MKEGLTKLAGLTPPRESTGEIGNDESKAQVLTTHSYKNVVRSSKIRIILRIV